MLFPVTDERLDISARMKLDLENVSSVLVELSEPRAVFDCSERILPSKLSQFAVHFAKNVALGSYSYIFEVIIYSLS